MRTFTLCEYQSVTIADSAAPGELSLSDVEALDRAQKAMGVEAFGWVNRTRIKAKHYVGIIATQNVRLEILPKIDRGSGLDATLTDTTRGALVKMIAAAMNVPVHDGEITKLASQDQDLLEIFMTVFATRLSAKVRQGLTRRYQRHEDVLPRLRGKLNVTQQFTRLVAYPDRLACEYDEFTADTPLNRLLLCAVQTLRRVTTLSRTQRLFSEIATQFDGVQALDIGTALKSPVLIDRRQSEWRVIERLARLLLNTQYQTIHGGPQEGVALLFDMNQLFEAYVARIAQKTLRPLGYDVRTQGPQNYLAAHIALNGRHRGAFATRPDIHVSGNDKTVIMDTKWKRLDDAQSAQGISQADAYQMYGYAGVYRADMVVLIYPGFKQSHFESAASQRWELTNCEAQLMSVYVNVLCENHIARTLRQCLPFVSQDVA